MRPRYHEKDKVLCYEPDDSKAKVLYDATIVRVNDSDPKHIQWVPSKVRCIFPVVILSAFCMEQYRDDDHREDAPHFICWFLKEVEHRSAFEKFHESLKKFRYLIHFKNWNNCHDRWVEDELIMNITPENRKKQEELAQEYYRSSKYDHLWFSIIFIFFKF